MIIHIVRHAEAIERSPLIPEEHRFLTRRGRRRFRQAAKSLDTLGIQPDIILTSPLVRSVQTADILAEKLRYKRELAVSGTLAPGFRPEALEDLLKTNPQAREIVLVGHEPDFGLLVQTLLGEQEPCALPKGGAISFKRGFDGGEATFLQMVTGSGKIITSRSKALDRLQNDGR
ncbi:protein phosphohistidine phosphatase SixA, putative [Citrifermentans bemidjiense Bem]|uniref:Protein phosphohistidine phosphatase SixA, putative n=1 Tax=Citrifermentans bemidjiense (strain ATCC BAA-1014 / DSM 16622 / JCM 12645 / Bem) TaxID=404380 RepID=B5EE98_CITBB|nr:histidine phosphatase family protein [Citrifermentans bemidjiense]ACH39243.1 protein phosphohistidine phosphatase SixA, putative [Citrifermentans bemidjiense Bem]